MSIRTQPDSHDEETSPSPETSLDRKEVLLEPGARLENLVPPRREPPMRPLPEFD